MSEPRYTASTITDDALDALYRRIETLEHVAAGNKRHVQLIVPDMDRLARENEQLRAGRETWKAKAEEIERDRDIHCAELEQAQAAIDRVRALADELFVAGPTPEHCDAGRRIFAVLDQPKERTSP